MAGQRFNSGQVSDWGGNVKDVPTPRAPTTVSGENTPSGLPGYVWTGGTTVAQAKDILHMVPVYVPAAITVTSLTVRTTSTNGAGEVARLGIYKTENSLSGGGNLVLDAGTVSVTSAGIKTISGLSQLLLPGWYWFVFVHNAAASVTFVFYLGHSNQQGTVWRGHHPGTINMTHATASKTYGDLDSTAPTPTYVFTTTYGVTSIVMAGW